MLVNLLKAASKISLTVGYRAPTRTLSSCCQSNNSVSPAKEVQVQSLHIRDLQFQTDTANSSSILSVLQHCQTLLRVRLQNSASLIDSTLPDVVQAHRTHTSSSRTESELAHARGVSSEYTKLLNHQAFVPLSALELNQSDAKHQFQNLEQLLVDVETAQQRLIGVIGPVTHLLYAKKAAAHRELAESLSSSNNHAPFLRNLDQPGLEYDLTHVVQAQAKAARLTARSEANTGSGEEMTEAHEIVNSQQRAELSKKVDTIMYASEEALLMARSLLKHLSTTIAFVHQLDVPVHPSQQLKVGAAFQKITQASVIVKVTSMKVTIDNIINDMKAFSVEKFGATPPIEINYPDGDLQVCIMPDILEYVISEALKNSINALIQVHGTWDLDESPPLVITVSRCLPDNTANPDAGQCGTIDPLLVSDTAVSLESPSEASMQMWLGPTDVESSSSNAAGSSHGEMECQEFFQIVIQDSGHGMTDDLLQNMHHFFYTSQKIEEDVSYGYSRSHGAQFSGLGVGVPMTKLGTRFMGGTVEWTDGHGLCVKFTLPVEGFSLTAC